MTQAERTALRKALEFVRSLKSDVDLRKARDKGVILAKKAYDASEFAGRLVLASKAQKILNRVSAAVREGRVDANALDRRKLRDIAGEAMTDWKANLTMRNFLSSAYNAGYYEQGKADRTKQFWLYMTRKDANVRPEHARWEGLLLPKNHPLVEQIFPPNGHNCRCRMKAVSRKVARQALDEGTATTTIPTIREVTYKDTVTGKRLKTIEGVDPGWLGAPNATEKRISELLERSLQRMEKT